MEKNTLNKLPKKSIVQNAHSHIYVPMMQNLIGGMATGLLYYIYKCGWLLYYNPVLLNSAFVIGLVVFSIFTIYRFFGDEIGMAHAIFILGYQTGKLTTPNNITKINLPNNKNIKLNDNAQNTINLILAAYDKHLPITAKAAKDNLNLTRQEFEAARDNLIKIGLLKNTRTNNLINISKDEALDIFRESL